MGITLLMSAGFRFSRTCEFLSAPSRYTAGYRATLPNNGAWLQCFCAGLLPYYRNFVALHHIASNMRIVMAYKHKFRALHLRAKRRQ